MQSDAAAAAETSLQEPPLALATAPPPCTLVCGCTLPAWHSGSCQVVLAVRKREAKKKEFFEAESAPSARELAKRARADGKLPPVKKPATAKPVNAAKPSPREQPTKRQRKRKRAAQPEASAVATASSAPTENAPPPKRTGSRGGTRSHGQPVWDIDDQLEDDAAAPHGGAAAVSGAPGVAAALSVSAGGVVRLGLSVHGKRAPGRPPSNNKSLAALRDYLGRGRHDPFANGTFSSVSQELVEVARGGKNVRWGCVCGGNVAKGGEELECRRCHLTFHTKCERLDYSPAELKAMAEKGSYICADCERQERADEGYDPALGRFIWQCRHCTRSFEEEDSHAAAKHGARCAREVSRRQWSCACQGKLQGKVMATQCTSCSFWFHFQCKSQQRNWWDGKASRDQCAACEAQHGKKGRAAKGVPSAAAAAAAAADGGAGAGAAGASASDQPESERPMSRATKTALVAPTASLGALGGDASVVHDEIGTLADGRVYVQPSTLGEGAGLGLFAGRKLARGDVVSSYYGVPLYREQLGESFDTSYVVRLPNSGGTLLNGKVYADAIRANPSNPAADGRYYPCAGAKEWSLGAGAMANDPRDRKRNNAMLTFVKPAGGAKALRELALVRPTLVATRDIDAGEEVFYSYGSDKPFEHIRKALQAQKDERDKERAKQAAVKLVWVPHAQ